MKTAANENLQSNWDEAITVSTAVQENTSLKPVKPNVKLNSKQKKYLNESLPLKVREVLEKAEKFEIFAEVLGENGSDGMGFYPNRIAVITDENEKKEVLETFYLDASSRPYPSACYVPHHAIRATYQNKTVEIEICYQCKIFIVKGSFGDFSGGLPFENRKSEEVLNRIIQNKGVELERETRF
ncbi:MAG TPA: hypothetical protein VK892_21045 [Pyrinomonadaceae bacterium]|nr:hypothetical protein [Pyrinomonadaceae bacterium]